MHSGLRVQSLWRKFGCSPRKADTSSHGFQTAAAKGHITPVLRVEEGGRMDVNVLFVIQNREVGLVGSVDCVEDFDWTRRKLE